MQSDKQPNPKPQCLVIKGGNGNSQIDIVPEEEALKIDSKKFCMFFDRVRMKTVIRIGKETIEFDGPIQMVDGKPLGLLKKLMMTRPGKYHTSYDIGNIGEYDESFFISDNLIQYSAKLRKHLLGKNGHKVIKTASKPYRLALSGDISFCWIEPEHKDEEL
jgi:hypothetical protein